MTTLEQQQERALREQAEKRHDHARRCKKSPDECLVCQGNIAWFRSLPAHTLSRLLEDSK